MNLIPFVSVSMLLSNTVLTYMLRAIMITDVDRMKKISVIADGIVLHQERKVTAFFKGISPYTFPGVMGQIRALLLRVNKRRKKAGLSMIPDLHTSATYRSMQKREKKFLGAETSET